MYSSLFFNNTALHLNQEAITELVLLNRQIQKFSPGFEYRASNDFSRFLLTCCRFNVVLLCDPKSEERANSALGLVNPHAIKMSKYGFNSTHIYGKKKS